MKNLPTFDQFINESAQTFKTIIEQDYDINNDKKILVNTNLTQDVINNVAKGGDAATKIKTEMVKFLKKRTGGIGSLSAFACNHIMERNYENEKQKFLGEEFKNVKLKRWWKLGYQEGYFPATISAGSIFVGFSPNDKAILWADLHQFDPIQDVHMPTAIIIKQN